MSISVSKLFRAYRLYNKENGKVTMHFFDEFQSSFELTGYITYNQGLSITFSLFQSSFELTGYITTTMKYYLKKGT